MVLTRFAPSPTGFLHIGNARTALFNWLFAKQNHGIFLLRLDDTDEERSTEVFAQAIHEDLGWLGIHHDRYERQSQRYDRYSHAIEKLKASGHLYPCYETPEELSLKRKRQLARGLPPIYDRAALTLSAEDKKALEDKGRVPHWRFKLDNTEVVWEDLSRGRVEFTGNHMSDPVLVKTDGNPVYTLASVVDDIELGVTHIIRGSDHVANTAIQIQLIQALGETPLRFTYAHLSLISDISGRGFSKRDGSLSLRGLREEGVEPMALNCFLATLGIGESIKPYYDMTALVEKFNIKAFSKSAIKFDPRLIRTFNQDFIAHMPWEVARDRLSVSGVTSVSKELWEVVRGNLPTLKDITYWQQVVSGTIGTCSSDKEVLKSGLEALPLGEWGEETWQEWTRKIQSLTHKRGKSLFMPLRLALTGREHGPEMKALVPLIGRDLVQNRLEACLQLCD